MQSAGTMFTRITSVMIYNVNVDVVAMVILIKNILCKISLPTEKKSTEIATSRRTNFKIKITNVYIYTGHE